MLMKKEKKSYIDIDKTCDFGSQCPVLSRLKVFLPVFFLSFSPLSPSSHSSPFHKYRILLKITQASEFSSQRQWIHMWFPVFSLN